MFFHSEKAYVTAIFYLQLSKCEVFAS